MDRRKVDLPLLATHRRDSPKRHNNLTFTHRRVEQNENEDCGMQQNLRQYMKFLNTLYPKITRVQKTVLQPTKAIEKPRLVRNQSRELGQLVNRYISLLKTIRTFEVVQASYLRKKVLQALYGYPTLYYRLITAGQNGHKRMELCSDAATIESRLYAEDAMNLQLLISQVESFLKDIRLDELNDLGKRVCVLQYTFFSSFGQCNQDLLDRSGYAKQILTSCGHYRSLRIKKYKEREDTLRNSSFGFNLATYKFQKRRRYFYNLNQIESRLMYSFYDSKI